MIPSGVIFYHLSQRGLFSSSAKKIFVSHSYEHWKIYFLEYLALPSPFQFLLLIFRSSCLAVCVRNSDILILKCFLLALFKYRKMSSKITVLLSHHHFLFLAALAALYLTLVVVAATLEFWHNEWLLKLETLQTFD